MVGKVNAKEVLNAVSTFKKKVEAGENPTNVTATQVGTYTIDEVDAKLALYAGTGDLPITQFGDLTFVPPNISVKYEGAATYNPAIAYNVEEDGSRNYLRSGCDGSQYGVYLCKYRINGLGNMESYSPLATVWHPAYLPATDRVQAVINGISNQVAVLGVEGTTGNTFFGISERVGTLNPDLHASGIKGGIVGTWSKSCSCVFAHKGVGYHFHYQVDESKDPAVAIVVNTLSPFPWSNPSTTQLKGWGGQDINGNAYGNYSVIPVSKLLSPAGPGLGNNAVYTEYTADIFHQSVFIQEPSIHAVFLSGDTYRLFFVHEQWASLADGTELRILVSRQVDVNVVAKTFTWNDNSLGPVQVIGNAAAKTVSYNGLAAYTDTKKYGLPALGNYRPSWGRCPRTGEILAQTNSVVYGGTSQTYLGVVPSATWNDPKKRDFTSKKPYEYQGNYPSPISISLRIPKVVGKDKLRVVSDAGYALISGINYNDNTVFTYPDGTTTTWALDTGRAGVPALDTGRILTEIDVNFNVRLSHGFSRSSLVGSSNVNELGAGTQDTSVTLGVFDYLDNLASAAASQYGTVKSVNTMVFIPRILTKKLAGKYLASSVVLMTNGDAYNYYSSGNLTGWSGGVLSAVAQTLSRLSGKVAAGVHTLRWETNASIGITVAEQTDYTFVGGSPGYSVWYPGNAGFPGQAVGVNDSDGQLFAIRDYQGHWYHNTEELFALPSSLGVVCLNTPVDSAFVQTVMTVQSFGRSKASLAAVVPKAKVIATQAVKGSWNVYFAEEVYCLINGRKGVTPKKTVNLASIVADPSNKTFYLYVYWTGTQFDCLVSVTALNADRSRIFIGTVVSGANQVTSVNVNKVVAIDGYSLSLDKVPFAVPGSNGQPTVTGILNWVFS